MLVHKEKLVGNEQRLCELSQACGRGLKEAFGSLMLLFIWRTGEDALVKCQNSVVPAVDVLGQGSGLRDDERIVQEEERLLRHGGLAALGGRNVRAGEVEHPVDLRELLPINIGIEGSIGICRIIDRFLNRRSTSPRLQAARCREHGIPHRFQREALAIGSPEKPVLTV